VSDNLWGLTDATLTTLAWECLWCDSRREPEHEKLRRVGALLGDHPATQHLASLLAGVLSHERARTRVTRPPIDDDGRVRLTRAEIITLRSVAPVSIARHLEAHRPMWQVMVTAGMPPLEAHDTVLSWRRSNTVLPNGQMVPDDLIDEERRNAPDRVYLPSGHTVTEDVASKVLALMRRRLKLEAIKTIRQHSGSGLAEARDDAEAIDVGIVRWGDDMEQTSAPTWVDAGARRAVLRAIEALLTERPFHWAVLAAARVVEDFSCATMSVAFTTYGELVMFYNPSFVTSLSPEQRMAVVLHEVNHVILGHVAAPPAETVVNSLAWTYACEITANEFVPWALPGEPITRTLFSLPPLRSTLERYHALVGCKLPPLANEDFSSWMLRHGATHHRDVDQHHANAPWKLLSDAANLVGDAIDRETLSMLGAAGHHLSHALVQLLTPEATATLRWNELLQQTVRALTLRRPTRRWPSRRAPERLGVVPGRRAERARRRVLVAIDTSASMSETELAQVATELRALSTYEVRVAVVQCDTELRAEAWLPRGGTLDRVLGRGGTDLRPPFDADVLRRYDPSVLVYFTDGHGDAPVSAPANVDVLWVLTGAAPRAPARWGSVVCMRARGERAAIAPP
jgi:predicted metal-dependent peptidase